MEFTGAVLVCNKKITNAIENYREKDRYYNQKYEEGKQKAIDEVDTWSKFAKWWYKDKNGCKWSMWKDRNLMMFDAPRFALFGFNYIDKDTYEWLKDAYWGESRLKNQLSALVKCGEPVYLNTQQAAFVNRFYKGE